MLRQVYAWNLMWTSILVLALIIIWGCFFVGSGRKYRGIVNTVLLCLSLAVILYATVLGRETGEFAAVLRPFASLEAARTQSEYYREMFMNAFLFFPLGLTLSHVLPRGWHRWGKIALTTLIGCLLSAAVEYTQYRYSLGLAEADDVICNTLGAFIGSLSLLVAHRTEKRRERSGQLSHSLTESERQFVSIIRAAMAGEAYSLEGGDWRELFLLAQQQKLLPILFEAVRKTPAAGENAALFAETKRQVIAQVMNQTVRTAEFSELYKTLRAAGLHPVVVKGQLCGRLYPLHDHRLSADDDMLIRDDEFFLCHDALLRAGLDTDTPADELPRSDEVTYTKKDSPLYIELHRHLFDSSEDAHDELNRFFADFQPVESGGFLAMPPHEHLLYLILHAYKHFVSCGIGLRQFCDIGLWAREYRGDIDWQRLHEQCESVHAASFAEAVFRIAREDIGIELEPPEPWGMEIDAEPLLHDTLCGGVYGSNDYTRLHSSTVTLNAVKASRRGERSSILRSIFPRKEYLERRYAYLRKRPYLLPVAWVQRIAHYAEEKRGSDSNSASGSISLARERIELMKKYNIM